jgi:hypothetical protein
MKLAPHEIATPLWDKLERHYQAILAKKRERLENPRIGEQERLQLAWEIHTIKDFIALGKPEAKKEADAGE